MRSSFPNIKAFGSSSLCGDCTLLALSRAIIGARPEIKNFCVSHYSFRVRNNNYVEKLNDGSYSFFDRGIDLDRCGSADPGVVIISLNTNKEKEECAKIFDEVATAMTELGYKRENDIEYFLKQFYVYSGIFTGNGMTYVMVTNISYKAYHAICSLFPRFVEPVVKNCPLTKEELSLCSSLLKDTSEFINAMSKISESETFRMLKIKGVVSGFSIGIANAKLETAKSEVESNEYEINRNIEEYRNLISEKQDRLAKLLYAQEAYNRAKEGEHDEELMDFLVNSKWIVDVSASSDSGTLRIVTASYLDVYDPEAAERIENNAHSDLYECIGRDIFTKDARKKLFHHIFSYDADIKIRTCAFFSIDIYGCEVRTKRCYTFPNGLSDRMPNPHLDIYECFGNSGPAMKEMLLSGNVIGCIMQTLAATKCINMFDSTVVGRLFKKVFYSDADDKFLELPDGRVVSPIEAIEWIKEQEGNHEADSSN